MDPTENDGQMVETVLADEFGLGGPNLLAAAESNSSISDRIERLRNGDPSVDLEELHADIKNTLLGEESVSTVT